MMKKDTGIAIAGIGAVALIGGYFLLRPKKEGEDGATYPWSGFDLSGITDMFSGLTAPISSIMQSIENMQKTLQDLANKPAELIQDTKDKINDVIDKGKGLVSAGIVKTKEGLLFGTPVALAWGLAGPVGAIPVAGAGLVGGYAGKSIAERTIAGKSGALTQWFEDHFLYQVGSFLTGITGHPAHEMTLAQVRTAYPSVGWKFPWSFAPLSFAQGLFGGKTSADISYPSITATPISAGIIKTAQGYYPAIDIAKSIKSGSTGYYPSVSGAGLSGYVVQGIPVSAGIWKKLYP